MHAAAAEGSAAWQPKFAIVTDSCNKVGRMVVAVEDMEPGELLLVEKSVFFVFGEEHAARACKQCGKPKTRVRCDKCRRFYCSDACRASEATLHDSFCDVFSNVPAVAQRCGVDEQLLTAVFEFALATMKDGASTRTLGDNGAVCLSASDAQSLFVHASASSAEWLASVTEAIDAVLNEAPASTAVRSNFTTDTLVQFAQCINANAHAIVEKSTSLGFGMFPLVAMLNHSCRPNCMYSSAPHQLPGDDGKKGGPAFLQVRVTSKVRRGEELFVRYSDIYRSFNQRQQAIKAERFFACACPRCQTVGAERELAGIRCQAGRGCRGYVYLQPTQSTQQTSEANSTAAAPLTAWDPLNGLPACEDVLAGEERKTEDAAANDASSSGGREQAVGSFSEIAYRVPASGDVDCRCDQCGAGLDANHPALAFCERLEAMVQAIPARKEDPALVSELEMMLKEASSLLHPMHVLNLQLYNAVVSYVQPSRAGAQLVAQAADRATICLTSAIMPERSIEAAMMLTTAAQIHFMMAMTELREAGSTQAAAQRVDKAVKLQTNARQHAIACLGESDSLVEEFTKRLQRVQDAQQRVSLRK